MSIKHPAIREPEEGERSFIGLPEMPPEAVQEVVQRVMARSAAAGLGFSDADGPLVLYAMEHGYRTPLSADTEAHYRSVLGYGIHLVGRIESVEEDEEVDGTPAATITLRVEGRNATGLARSMEERARKARVAIGLGWPAMTPDQWKVQREAQERAALIAELVGRGVLKGADEAHELDLSVEDLRAMANPTAPDVGGPS